MKRKNILFIMADQMAAPMLPFYGPSPIKLPNLSRLAEQGVLRPMKLVMPWLLKKDRKSVV